VIETITYCYTIRIRIDTLSVLIAEELDVADEPETVHDRIICYPNETEFRLRTMLGSSLFTPKLRNLNLFYKKMR
jgi:hypothetical protein